MRPFLALLALILAPMIAAQEDPLAGFRFVDGQEHRLGDWPGQPVLIMYFCSHCPTAKKWMSTTAVEIGKKIDQDHLAAQLICVTPEFSGEQLKAYAAANCAPILQTALFANDPANRQDISLKNICQAELWIDGTGKDINYNAVADAVAEPFKASTAFLFPVSCELSDQGKAAWWAVERGRPGAFASCVQGQKKSPEAKAIVEAVEKTLLARQEKLVAAEPSMAGYEALEDLCADGAGLPSLKPAAERLRALGKDPALKDELKARDIFRAATKQAAGKKPSDIEAGKANLAQLAQKLPNTVYGQRAAAAK